MKRFLCILLSLAAVFSCMAGLTVSADEKAEPDIDPESPLYKKMALFVGDSICEAIYEQRDPDYNYRFGWGGRILYNNDMRGVNLGKSGASVSNCRGANTILAQLKSQATNGDKFDYVIVHGGVNDAWDSCAVGAMTEGFEGPFDMATFAGGLETTFKYLKETYPNAYYGYIINFTIPNSRQASLADMSAYFTVAKEICDKWEIPYLDFYFDEDFNKNIMKTHTDENLYDYIHCRTSGYEILTPRIEAWMETLHLPPEPEVEESSEEESVEVSAEESIEASAPAESSAPAEDKGGVPVYVYVIIAVAAVAVIAAVVILIRKKK